jgi:hypothetical protein
MNPLGLNSVAHLKISTRSGSDHCSSSTGSQTEN